MRTLKSQVLLRLVNSYMVDSPQPANISYFWNFGSLLGVCLIIQILSGIFLAMHYTPHVDLAFNSVEHIMRDVNSGWAIRYTHANVASFFFIFVYAQTQFYLFYCQKMYSIFNNINLFKKIIDDFLNIINSKPVKYSDSKKLNTIKDVEFLQWFVGFSDAESSFIINTKNEREVYFTFQITLHIDDVGVLYIIRDKLGIGVVSIRGNTSSYRISSFEVIIKILLPIFDEFPLLTHKQLDYKDWKRAIILKKLGQENGRSLHTNVFLKILDIKNNINKSRTNYENYVLYNDMVNKN